MIQKTMQRKKAQVTIFIIIGIIIVGGMATYFLISNGKILNSNSKFPEVTQIIEDCLQNVTLDGIYFNSLQGGYYDLPENSIISGFIELPVYFDNGKGNLPEISVWESELTNYIKKNVGTCFNLSEFEDYEIREGENPQVRSSIQNSKIFIEVENSVYITKDETFVEIKKFEKEIYFDYNSIYNALKTFLETQNKQPTEILLSQIELIGEEFGFRAEVAPLIDITNSTDYMYGFIYNSTKYKNKEYIFAFGVKY